MCVSSRHRIVCGVDGARVAEVALAWGEGGSGVGCWDDVASPRMRGGAIPREAW
jgi:hypothetical protein